MKTGKLKQDQILHVIMKLLLRKGLKGLTMDLLASELSMSKRTLYEMFGSKNQLIALALDYLFGNLREMFRFIFTSAPDAITALSEVFNLQQELFCILTLDFFHDMDKLYPEIRKVYKEKYDQSLDEWIKLYQKGVREGVLRSDVNYIVLREMMTVQMEALKRMEERFEGQFTLEEIFITITSGFLRGIATDKGMKILDGYTRNNSTNDLLQKFINAN